MPESNNLWEQVGNECLSKALNLLKSETAPTAATAEAVGRLVETAVSIDVLNRRWARFQCSDSKYLSELAEQRAIAAFANHSPSERR